MNRIYPTFAAAALAGIFGESAAREAPKIFFYAVNDGYEYLETDLSLQDVPVESRVAKSVEISVSTPGKGTLLVEPQADAFNRQPLTGVTGIIVVAEWDDGASLLILYQDTWLNTGVPFMAPTTVDLSFGGNFAFRLGNIGPEA